MQATIETLEELGISLDSEIKCYFTYNALKPCGGIAVARITFRCECGYNGTPFVCARCLNAIRNFPETCRCGGCWQALKTHWWGVSRVKWAQI